MPDTHSIAADLARLNTMEPHIIDRFSHRQRVAKDITARHLPLGERVADKVAAFGGSWTFIGIAVTLIAAWMLANVLSAKAFDPFPYILLNLVLSCLAALQAPIIMMSQNRQAAHDRLDAQHDYEINIKAELEIVALHTKLDEIRDQKWMELMKAQEEQLALLVKISK
jgi:uncharacterized membrane protein